VAWARVQGPVAVVTAGVSSLARTFSSNVTAGNMISASATNWNAGVKTLTGFSDTLSNTYGTDASQTSTGSRSWQGSAANITGGACTVTATWDTTADVCFAVNEYSGIATSSHVHTSNGTAAATADLSVTVNPTVSVLAVAVLSHNSSGGTIGPDTDYTERQEIQGSGDSNLNVSDRAISGSDTVVFDNPAVDSSAVVVCYVEATGGGGDTSFNYLGLLGVGA